MYDGCEYNSSAYYYGDGSYGDSTADGSQQSQDLLTSVAEQFARQALVNGADYTMKLATDREKRKKLCKSLKKFVRSAVDYTGVDGNSSSSSSTSFQRGSQLPSEKLRAEEAQAMASARAAGGGESNGLNNSSSSKSNVEALQRTTSARLKPPKPTSTYTSTEVASPQVYCESEIDETHANVRRQYFVAPPVPQRRSGDREQQQPLSRRHAAVQAGFRLERFKQGALIGSVDSEPDEEQPPPTQPSVDSSSSSLPQDDSSRPDILIPLFLNTGDPFCLAVVGQPSSGKSHTVACIVESALLSFSTTDIIRLVTPMSVLALHRDRSVGKQARSTLSTLCTPSYQYTNFLHASFQPFVGRIPFVDKEHMIVLASPSNFQTTRSVYAGFTVLPLLLSFDKLSLQQLRILLRLDSCGEESASMHSLSALLREWYKCSRSFTLEQFLREVKQSCGIRSADHPVALRLRELENVLLESTGNAVYRDCYSSLESCCKPGNVVLVDLTDPSMSAAEANSLFSVVMEQYRGLSNLGAKLVCVEDFSGVSLSPDRVLSEDQLGQQLAEAARHRSRENLRLIVSSASPHVIPSGLLELVDMAVLHAMQSPDWFHTVSLKFPIRRECFERLRGLEVGQALLYVSRFDDESSYGGIVDGLDQQQQQQPRLPVAASDLDLYGLGRGVLPVTVRPRITG